MSIHIRPAKSGDLPEIVSIYNESILKKGLTADLEPQSAKDKNDWFRAHQEESYPLFVAEQNGELVGWISLSPYREGRKALRKTAEVSLYLSHKHTGKGIGSYLMEHIVATAKELGFKHMIAIIIGSNAHSIQLFKKFKFRQWGLFPGIVEIGDEVQDHCIYGRSL